MSYVCGTCETHNSVACLLKRVRCAALPAGAAALMLVAVTGCGGGDGVATLISRESASLSAVKIIEFSREHNLPVETVQDMMGRVSQTRVAQNISQILQGMDAEQVREIIERACLESLAEGVATEETPQQYRVTQQLQNVRFSYDPNEFLARLVICQTKNILH